MCILVVEDEFMTRESARECLEDAGYEVLTADDGREAIEHLTIYPGRFTCLVVDFHMPGGVHGGHVVERMREFYPGIPIILASASPQATLPAWRDHHRVTLLVKPYFADELLQVVQEGLG